MRFLLTPLREGRPAPRKDMSEEYVFLLTPLREGRQVAALPMWRSSPHFYSRPCGRGDAGTRCISACACKISTHAPAGGATATCKRCGESFILFLLTPLREGRRRACVIIFVPVVFLLTPLREGRRLQQSKCQKNQHLFLLTPLREGRLSSRFATDLRHHFYSRPCGRGDRDSGVTAQLIGNISTHALAGGATKAIIFAPQW